MNVGTTYSALFIDTAYLKKYTPLGASIDPDEVYPFVYEAQTIYTQEQLGTPLYNDLVERLATGGTFSDMEWHLINTFSKSLAYFSVYLALPHLHIKMRNAGVLKANPEYTTGSSLDEVKYIRNEVSELAEYWAQRTIKLLCEYSDQWPLYDATSKDIQPTSSQYDSDIYLDCGYNNIPQRDLDILRKYLD